MPLDILRYVHYCLIMFGSHSNRKGTYAMYKMRELVDATGVSKATILYYIREGLLPKPVKKHANVAFYPESFIEKIDFIKQLQSKHRLSLAQIKNILKEQERGREVTPLIELNEVVFGPKGNSRLSRGEFCKATGLSKEQLKQAIEKKLVNPKEEERFDSEDVAVGKMLKRILDFGISFERLSFYSELAGGIVEQELSIQSELVAGKRFEEIISITMELTGIARSFRGYVIDRIFQEEVGQRGLDGNKKGSVKSKHLTERR